MLTTDGMLVKNTVLRVKTNESIQQDETLESLVSRHWLLLGLSCCQSR